MDMELRSECLWDNRTLPCDEFEDDAELEKALRYWQSKLFLNDWIIKAKLVEPRTLYANDIHCTGTVNLNYEIKTASIEIEKQDFEAKTTLMKVVHEKVLVHEVLHLKYNILDVGGTYEARVVDCLEHQLLEQMAKTLVMVKYGLDLSYFINME